MIAWLISIGFLGWLISYLAYRDSATGIYRLVYFGLAIPFWVIFSFFTYIWLEDYYNRTPFVERALSGIFVYFLINTFFMSKTISKLESKIDNLEALLRNR